MSPHERPILEVRNVSKRFPGVLALDDVDFDVKPGEVHVLLGENGAGKSTLMKILSGAYTKDEGEILIRGESVEIASPLHAKQLGIGIIYQSFNQADHLTVAENILLGREPLTRWGTIDWAKHREEVQAALEQVGLEVDPDARVLDLSPGHRQMAEIAQALSLDASVLIMDEPTSALSRQETERLFEIIHALEDRGVAIIYISHRLEELKEIGDRVTVLRNGKKVGTLSIEEAEMSQLVRMMVGHDVELTEITARPRHTPEMLRVENLTRHGVLDDISFKVNAGEIVTFAGLVGSGRSETVRAIFGVDPLDSGEIYLDNNRVDIHHPEDAVRLGLGFLTEDRLDSGLAMDLSVNDNVTLPSLPDFEQFGFLTLKREQAAVRDAIEQLDIKTPSEKQIVRYLSGGNQQKVVLAKWLMANSRILLLDEPTQGIDVGAKEEVHRLMVDFVREQGGAIVMVSSDLQEVLRMSHRILVMREGRIVANLLGENATRESVMQHALGVKQQSVDSTQEQEM